MVKIDFDWVLIMLLQLSIVGNIMGANAVFNFFFFASFSFSITDSRNTTFSMFHFVSCDGISCDAVKVNKKQYIYVVK